MALTKIIRTAFRGVTGLGQSAAGINLADEQAIQDRRRICAMCDHATARKKTGMRGLMLLSLTSRCGLCHCAIHAKTRLKRERCPVDKW